MNRDSLQKLIDEISNSAELLKDDNEQYDALLAKIGDARIVMLGEASHGTEEFYQARITITRRLLAEHGFMAVAIEGDWPDAHHVHRYLQGEGKIADSTEVLREFKRFPTWMWRNTAMRPFIEWVRAYNDNLSLRDKIGFYGLDLYSLHSSMQAVIDFLLKVDPEAAAVAKKRYACFDHLAVDPQMYGYLVNAGVKRACINETVAELMELQERAFEYRQHDGITAEDNYFFAIQNARLVKNAENYYRKMLEGRVSSWNIRDKHMAETLTILAEHLEKRFKRPAKIVIWAHNSHVGDARATEMGERGEFNIGQLVREQYQHEAYSIGFSTYEGMVTAADDWDEPAKKKQINPGLRGSYEELFHQIPYKNFLLDLTHHEHLQHLLKLPRLQRAIGVIYRPETERFSHYFFTHLPSQFNALIHFDKTSALTPLN